MSDNEKSCFNCSYDYDASKSIEFCEDCKGLWGAWECPVCGNECSDPVDRYSTTCDNGHAVTLGPIDSKGCREVWTQDDMCSESIEG